MRQPRPSSGRTRLPLLAAAGALVLLAGCGDPATTHHVQITEFGFEPATITVAVGDEVRWVNQNTGRVTVTGVEGSPTDPLEEPADALDELGTTAPPDDASLTTPPDTDETDGRGILPEEGPDEGEENGEGEDSENGEGEDSENGEGEENGEDEEEVEDPVDMEEATELPEDPDGFEGTTRSLDASFDSGPILQGGAYALRLEEPGRYLYRSVPQEALNWYGTIIVEAP